MTAPTPAAVTPEAALAREFLATLRDERAPWAAGFERFADEHSLGPELRRATKTAVLKIRVFGVIDRHERRAARGRR